ncbi:MAG: hypothetical protein HC777_03685 [Hyphomonadaceae bacterium]|nr:hypothetical protein [Hyphomonadaceae bacterium]
MWLMTPLGFFSLVEKPEDRIQGTLTIRARARIDLENLRETYLPSLSPTLSLTGTDYPHRATASRQAIGEAIRDFITNDLNYSNFKNEVAAAQGRGRAKVYGEVWQVLLDLETL